MGLRERERKRKVEGAIGVRERGTELWREGEIVCSNVEREEREIRESVKEYKVREGRNCLLGSN